MNLYEEMLFIVIYQYNLSKYSCHDYVTKFPWKHFIILLVNITLEGSNAMWNAWTLRLIFLIIMI
jgi:hypothetical protein